MIPDYGAAKAALNNMTVGLSQMLAGSGITVNSISPGVILTSGVEGWFRHLAQKFDRSTEWPEIEKPIANGSFCQSGATAFPADS